MTSKSSELKFLLKHSSIYGIGTVLSRAVAFFLLPLYTRYLTPTDYGVLELIDTTTGLVGIVVGLGISASVSRFFYQRETEAERGRLISTVYITVAVGTTVLLLFANLTARPLARLVLDSESYTLYFRLAFVNLLLGLIVDIGQGYLRMLYKSVLFIALSTASLIVGVSLNVLFIAYFHFGVLSILYTTFIVRLLMGIPLTAVILYSTGIHFSMTDARELLKYSLPVLPASLGNALLNYSDRYFIKSFATVADAGVYGLANKLGSILHILVTGPFIGTFQPRRFQLAKEREDLKEVLQTVFDGFFMVLLFLSLCVAVFSHEVMVTMTTAPFYQAGDFVPMLLLTNLIFGMKYHVDFGIFFTGKTQYYMWANIITAVVQLVGAFFLVRAFGMWGAAYAGLLSTSVNFVLLYVFASRLYPIAFNFARSAKALALAAVVYFVSRRVSTDRFVIDVALKTVLVAGYLLALPLVRLVSPSEIAQVRELARAFFKRSAVPAASSAP